MFTKIAIAYLVFFVAISWLDKLFNIKDFFEKVSVEAYLGLGATIVTGFLGTIRERLKRRDEMLKEGQVKNFKTNEENHLQTLNLIAELEGRIDEIRLAMNAFESLNIKDEKQEQELSVVKEDFAKLNVKIAQLTERQIQGDRVAILTNSITQCLVNQEKILNKLN